MPPVSVCFTVHLSAIVRPSSSHHWPLNAIGYVVDRGSIRYVIDKLSYYINLVTHHIPPRLTLVGESHIYFLPLISLLILNIQ